MNYRLDFNNGITANGAIADFGKWSESIPVLSTPVSGVPVSVPVSTHLPIPVPATVSNPISAQPLTPVPDPISTPVPAPVSVPVSTSPTLHTESDSDEEEVDNDVGNFVNRSSTKEGDLTK